MLINRLGRRFINLQKFKKQQNLQIKSNPKGVKLYPKTFEQKIALLNSPKSIKTMQIIEYGVKYKSGNKYLYVSFIALAFFMWLQQRALPINVSDMYFRISTYTLKTNESSSYAAGYFFSLFNFQYQFYFYIPLTLCLLQFTRFVNKWTILPLYITNAIVSGLMGPSTIRQRVSKYEVWENQNLRLGEGTFLSFATSFWTALGFKDGFTDLKSKIFLKTIPGIGIVRKGIPIASICLFYTTLQAYFGLFENKKNFQFTGASILIGILYGLLLRKTFPIVK